MSAMRMSMSEGIEIDGVTMYLSDFGISTPSYFDADANERYAYHIDGDADDSTVSSKTDKLKAANMVVIASPVYFYGLSAELKAIIDRLHTPMRNEFKIKKLALILVGAATLPELFDSIIMQYKLVLNFFHLEDAGMVLVRGAKDKGVVSEEALKDAYNLGISINIE